MTTSISSNSKWPNGLKVDDEGYTIFYNLGTNKIDIPTEISEWPTGTKLVSPYVYDENDKLVGFCDTNAMVATDGTTTTLPYSHIEANFSSIVEGTLTINTPNTSETKITYVKSIGDVVTIAFEDLTEETKTFLRSAVKISDNTLYDANDNVIGRFGFDSLTTATNVVDFVNGETTDGKPMDGLFLGMNWDTFEQIEMPITIFESDLSLLENGDNMFFFCKNLTSFKSKLPKLETGDSMFDDCISLSSFEVDMPSLTNGQYMFVYDEMLTTFKSDMHSLTNGYSMFQGSSNLSSFESNLSSLVDGEDMFDQCKLDAKSVKNILETISTSNNEGILTLGVGCDSTSSDKLLFAKECGYEKLSDITDKLYEKGWISSVQLNGRPSSTYSLKRGVEESVPVFVKLVETEKHADYTSLDGTKNYRLKYFHVTSGSTEGYTQFNSLEEAIETLNIKPKERH